MSNFIDENLMSIRDIELYSKEKQAQFYSSLKERVKHHIMILE